MMRVPAATCRGVRCRQSTWLGDSGTSSIRRRTMFGGGLDRTHVCRLEENREWAMSSEIGRP
jgi:hypothetical protein